MHEVIIQSLSKGDLSVSIHCVSALLQLTSTRRQPANDCWARLSFYIYINQTYSGWILGLLLCLSLQYSICIFSTIQVSFINSCMAVLLSDITTLFWPCQSFILKGDIMSVSTQVQRWLFQTFIYPGKIFVKSGGLWSTGQLPGVTVYTWTVEHELRSTGFLSAIKTVVADGSLNQWTAGVKPTSFSDL